MVREIIESLRAAMRRHGIDGYIIPSTDPHQSEYVPAVWERRRFCSGFTGSAGDLVISAAGAALFTDSRYFIQAAQQLAGTGIELMKLGLPGTPTIPSWFASQLDEGQRVGIDPRLHTHGAARELQEVLHGSGIELVSIEENLVDPLWGTQPPMPSGAVELLPLSVTGESRAAKLARLRGAMAEQGITHHVITTLDAIAWLLNMRGTDVEFNPVVIAYLILSQEQCTLFTDLSKLDDPVRAALERDVTLAPYERVGGALEHIASERVLLDAGSVSRWVVDRLGHSDTVTHGISPVTIMKARKNETELAGFHACHLRDGVAMVEFLSWLKSEVSRGGVTEISASDKLEAFRRVQERFRGLSFGSISAYGAHGAIVHYSATPESDIPLEPRGVYLIDSGAQYTDGTTDITRTVSLGPVSPREKRLYTLVLKGHIDLSMARFPVGTVGKQLDTIARKPLWDDGVNYSHGTGHGVGAFLNVHEGPHAISYYRCVGVPFEPGMVTSNEPGYYEEGAFGIRIENLIYVVPDTTPGFNTFANLTLCPMERELIEPGLLTDTQRAWLESYHTQCRELLSPHLSPTARAWLNQVTAPIL